MFRLVESSFMYASELSAFMLVESCTHIVLCLFSNVAKNFYIYFMTPQTQRLLHFLSIYLSLFLFIGKIRNESILEHKGYF
jgi:hypothetical protein